MFSTMLSAAVLTLSVASAPSPSAVYLKGDSAHVPYSDLDLASDTDRQQLVRRIEHAARLLCEAPGPAPLIPLSSETECFRLATADGLAQMKRIVARQ